MTPATHQKLSRSSLLLLLALTAAFICALIYQAPYLLNPNTVDEDLRNLYWINRAQDPDLYPEDVLNPEVMTVRLGSGVFTVMKFAPGYSTIFMVLGAFVSPFLLSKLLIFPLLLLAVAFLFKLVESQSNDWTAFGVSIGFIGLDLVSSTNISTNAGLQRSFSYPLLIAFAYYLARGKSIPAAIVLFFSGLLYPPVFMLLGISGGLYLLKILIRERFSRRLFRSAVPFAAAVLLVIVCLLPAFTSQVANPTFAVPSELEGQVPFADMILKDGYRYPLFTIFPILGAGGLFMDAVDLMNTLVLLGLTLVAWLLLRRDFKKPPEVFGILLLAGGIGFLLSWLGIWLTHSMIFHLPSRLTQSLLPLVLFYAFGVNARALMAKLLGGLVRLTGRTKKNPPEANLEVKTPPAFWAVLAVPFAVIMIWYLSSLPTGYYSPSSTDIKLIEFVSTLPKDTMIAGDPCSLDDIPLFAKRQILFSCEKPNPNPDIIMGWMNAYYSDRPEEIVSFCSQHQIDYLVVNLDSFEPPSDPGWRYYFEPYNRVLVEKMAQAPDFALQHLAQEAVLYSQGQVRVIPCGMGSFAQQE